MIRIGTRGSKLALIQAEAVKAALVAAHGLKPAEIEIVVLKTSGDRIQDRSLSEVGGKGLFTKEIEAALIAGEIDIAAHSMKDVETKLPGGLVMAAYLPREDAREALIARDATSIDALPLGARFGTSSLRRGAQLRRMRPDLQIVPLRGNVDTRLRKVETGEIDATLLAVAGLKRMGLIGKVSALIPAETMLPALAQGAIGMQVRDDDSATRALLGPIDEPGTNLCITAERAVLARLDGSCRTPIAGRSRFKADGDLEIEAEVLSPDGTKRAHAMASGPARRALALADEVSGRILEEWTPWREPGPERGEV